MTAKETRNGSSALLIFLAYLCFITVGCTPRITLEISAEDLQDPKTILLEARRIADKEKNRYEQRWQYMDIAIWQAILGDLEEAIDTFARSPHNQRQYFPIKHIAEELLNRGHIEEAFELTMALDDSFRFKAEALTDIARYRIQNGDIQEALKIANQLSGYLKADVDMEIAQAHAQNGNTKAALQTISLLNIPGEKWRIPSALTRVAQVQVKRGEVKAAINTMNSIQDPEWREEKFPDFVETLASNGHISTAINLARKVESPYLRIRSLANISNELIKLKQNQRALRVLDEALTSVLEVPEGEYRGLAIDAIGRTQALTGERSKVNETLSSLASLDAKVSLLRVISFDLNEVGRMKEALEYVTEAIPLAEEITDPYSRDNTLYLIVRELAKAGQTEHAFRIALSLSRRIHPGRCIALGIIAEMEARKGNGMKAVIVLNTLDDTIRSLDCDPQVEYSEAFAAAKESNFPKAAQDITNAIYQRYGGKKRGTAWAELQAGHTAEALHTIQKSSSPTEVSRFLIDIARQLIEKTYFRTNRSNN